MEDIPCFMANIIEINDIEWKTPSQLSIINITEDELVEWFYTHKICDKCGRPDKNIISQGFQWNAYRLCTNCD